MWPDGGKTMQRRAQYKNSIGRPVGVTLQSWRNSRKLGWYHKRNYTVFLSENIGNSLKFPGVGSVSSGTWQSPQAGFPAINQLSQVMCAISTMDQSRYRITSGRWNAVCMYGTSPSYNQQAWSPNRPAYGACTVNFRPRGSKRDAQPIGYLGGEAVYSVEMMSDPSDGWEGRHRQSMRDIINDTDTTVRDEVESKKHTWFDVWS
ncbi:hypothetical protein F5Y04DRAFT_184862 [Hypomontagnella monticulosa]|nr:hypothetical protein F5Y04DRAFT_184862 [Hypomontagnella monticulosa]